MGPLAELLGALVGAALGAYLGLEAMYWHRLHDGSRCQRCGKRAPWQQMFCRRCLNLLKRPEPTPVARVRTDREQRELEAKAKARVAHRATSPHLSTAPEDIPPGFRDGLAINPDSPGPQLD